MYVALCLELEQSSVLSLYHPAQFTGLRLSVSAMGRRLVRRRAQPCLWHRVEYLWIVLLEP